MRRHLVRPNEITGARPTRLRVPPLLAALVLLAATALALPLRAQGDHAAHAQGSTRLAVDLAEAIAADPAGMAARLPAWAEPIEAGQTHVHLSPEEVTRLRTAGVPLAVRGSAPALQASWPRCVARLDAHLAWARELAAERPDLVQLIDIGDSHCKQQGGCITPGRDRLPGDDLLVLRISAHDPATAGELGRIFVDGGLHARELATTELMRAFAETIVRGYGVDAATTWLLDHRAVYVGLASNPDGRRLVELGTREEYGGAPWYVRKNANDESGGRCAWPPRINEHLGVDLNRNHLFAWDAPGHSRQPCGETYRGSAAASEAEIAAYEAFVRSILPDQRGPENEDAAPRDSTGLLINFHSFTTSGTVLVPWGWTSVKSPNDTGLAAIARRYADLTGYAWRYALYPVSGNTRDWAYGELGVPAYVIELQDEDFFPTCARLPGRLRAQQPGLALAAAISDRPYARIRGPEVRELVVERGDGGAGPGAGAGILRVRAHADDTAFARGDGPGGEGGEGDGPAAVAGAEVLVGRYGYVAEGGRGSDGAVGPLGEGPGTAGPAAGARSDSVKPAAQQSPPRADRPRGEGRPLGALDGTFGGATEALSGTLDIAGLAPGRWYAVVRAQDEAGSWGPPAVAAFTVDGPTWTPAPPATETPIPTETPTPTLTPAASATATATPAATHTPTPTLVPPIATASATPTSSATPTRTPPPIPDGTTSPVPSGTPRPSGTPSVVAPRWRVYLPFALDDV